MDRWVIGRKILLEFKKEHLKEQSLKFSKVYLTHLISRDLSNIHIICKDSILVYKINTLKKFENEARTFEILSLRISVFE